jgi:hypothetical protein
VQIHFYVCSGTNPGLVLNNDPKLNVGIVLTFCVTVAFYMFTVIKIKLYERKVRLSKS